MINPAAIGVAILILLAATATVGSSSIEKNPAFEGSQQTLSDLLARVNLKDAMQSYQRHVNTLILDPIALESPHLLQIEVPAGTSLQGQILINDEVRFALDSGPMPIDLGPYLQTGQTQVVVTGTYTPASALVLIHFEGPDTLVQQQTEGAGELNYQLNLVVK